MTPTWIAELRVILVHPDGRREPGHIAVGQPYTLAGGDPAASFECRDHGTMVGGARTARSRYANALRAALQVAGWRLLSSDARQLHDFVSRGGRVLDPEEGRDLELESMFCGLYRKLDAPKSE